MSNEKHSQSLADLEAVACQNANLTFEEYQAIKEPAINILLRDFAVKAVEKAKESGISMTFDEAMKLAKKEIPSLFVPEWMKNLRIGANIAGTELIYLEGIKGQLDAIYELLHICLEDKLEAYIDRHAGDFHKTDEGDVKNE